MTVVHLVVPDTLVDPRRPSGGSVYDRRVADALRAGGWTVHEHAVRGDVGRDSLTEVLAPLVRGSLVVVDGLLTRGAGVAIEAHAGRLHLVVLLHEPVGPDPDERTVLEAAAAVVTTSRWTADRVASSYGLDRRRLHVARPGVDESPAHEGTEAGRHLLCVGVVSPAKGQSRLVEALASLTDLTWDCRVVGSRYVEPSYARATMLHARRVGLGDRLTWTGPLVGDRLDAEYAAADLLVLPSLAETYGMVVTEALAHAVPVVASAVGGVAEALGRTPDGAVPGLLVGTADPAALAQALRRWLTDPGVRTVLRRRARERRTTLSGWDTTAETVAGVLDGIRHHRAVAT
ncbi:glycosyltransferase family 4 protein [Mumia zhuanghuii]|uniref:Glycosyltransferase family 4 protein n=2 Tax=Mumia TaxID=1546255 RepID=A0ABW1QMU7_9ACTN|nr:MULTISPECIES: glycosyltransferase family 4 protein [Mumia]KAA1423318.1 glycosyltransferase family 4 protein [Mumia zhuanghuii]